MNASARLVLRCICGVVVAAVLVVIPVDRVMVAQSSFPEASAAAPDGQTGGSALFIANVGQFDTGARFRVWGAGPGVWLADDAIWFTLLEQGSRQEEGQPQASLPSHPSTRQPDTVVNLKLSFPGANPQPRLEPFERLGTHVSYFRGSDPSGWRTDVPVWGGVRYRDLYPNIDLEVTSNGGRLVQRLVVAPGADLSAVRLRVEGAEGVQVRDGQMRLRWAAGEVSLPLLTIVSADGAILQPVGYEPQVSVVTSGVDGIPAADIAHPFTAPVAAVTASGVLSGTADLIYSTYLGGNDDDRSWNYNGLAVDPTGAAYVVGYTYSSNFPSTPGSYNPIFRGDIAAAFVVKFDPTGSSLAYATFLSGAGSFYGEGIAVDATGAAYVSWDGKASDAPIMHSVPDQLAEDWGNDLFVSKLNATGSALVYSLRVAGSGSDETLGLAIDASGAAYVTGYTYSANFPAPGGFDTSLSGGQDAFVVKVKPDGTGLAYGTFLGGSKGEWGWHVAVDSNGAAYVIGTTWSGDFPTTGGAFDRSYSGGDTGDAFVVKLNPSGSALTYGTYLGGSTRDYGQGIALDAGGMAYVTGTTDSSDFPTTAAAFDRSCGGCNPISGTGDAFVTKLDAAGGALVYSTFLGGSKSNFDDNGTSIAVNPWGVAYVTGWTRNADFPVTADAYDTSHNSVWDSNWNGTDAFVTLLDATGSALVYSTFLGGYSNDDGYAIAVGSDGAAYVRGYTGYDFPTTAGAFDRTANGDEDVFVAKLLPTIIGRPSPTVTPTRTRTPTRTPTPTPTFTPTPTATPLQPDLIADGLEVTQAIQDLFNNVRLVANKPTYVRFHVHSTYGEYNTEAQLRLRKGSDEITLTTDSRIVRPKPDRGVYTHSFLFALPDGYRDGAISLTAEVNPDNSWRDRNPIETRSDNNTIAANVAFEAVPPVNLVIYRVGYEVGGRTYYPAASHAYQLTDWIRRAYPASTIRSTYRTLDQGRGLPACRDVNSSLTAKRLWDRLFSSIPGNARYYGMVDDGGGFMRGCAADIPALVASGPTGSNPWGWDFDGSYGDWYGGHELGHAYGQRHVLCRGDEGGSNPAYPFRGGKLSGVLQGPAAFYGFDIGSFDIYGPDWNDIMSYCGYQWMSEYTSEQLMSLLQASTQATEASASSDRADRLLVVGALEPSSMQLDLQPLFVIPDAEDAKPRTPGTYAIVLRSATAELARYPFAPAVLQEDPAPNEGTTFEAAGILAIEELVPYVPGTTRVDIEGPGGTVIKTITAGPATPTVTVTEPLGGAVLDGDKVTVAWTASDPDGDPLAFNVQYSPDGGATWELVAQNLQGTSVELDASNFTHSQGQNGLIRVWASGGIQTGQGESAAFSIPNRPPAVEIVAPVEGVTVAAGQTLAFEGQALDPDLGDMPDDLVQWSSDRDGALGQGGRISVAKLSVGTHTVTFRADDGAGGVSSRTVHVTVVNNPWQLPPPTDELVVGPTAILLNPDNGVSSVQLYIENRNPGRVLPWNATASEPWVHLSAAAGNTPAQITIGYSAAGLVEGTYAATISLTSLALPGVTTLVPVQLVLTRQQGYLPLILRSFDSSQPRTPAPSPTPTATPTPTVTQSATSTPTATSSATVFATATATPSLTPTPTPTATPTMSATPTVTPSLTSAPTTTPSATATPTATHSLTPTATPTPTLTGAGIHGRVTLNAVAAAGLMLELQRKDGGAWTTVAETETNAGGLYNFTGADSLTAGQEYRVSYGNTPDDPNPGPGYLWSWLGRRITGYAAGAAAAGGDFDVEDIVLASPADDASVTLPAMFCWTPRSAASDNYRLLFLDPSTGQLAGTGYLGKVGCVTVSSLSAGWPSGRSYMWWVQVYEGSNPDATPYNNYGDSYGDRMATISFQASGPGPGSASLLP